MKKTFFYLFFMAKCLFLTTQSTAQTVSVVPKPAKMIVGEGRFTISNKTKIYVSNDAEARRVAQEFANRLKIDGTIVSVSNFSTNASKSGSNAIFFILNEKIMANTEGGYLLNVSPNQINVQASTAQGLFYATQTLYQLLPNTVFSTTKLATKQSWTVPAIDIEDKPRYVYRGMHLDVCRHFQPVSFVKKYIDMLALHKFNTFHWHLTEDQGWRIEIKKYPKLTEIGGFRSETLIGHYGETVPRYDGKRYGGYYTQEQIKEIVAYAAARFITVVPEIEMPGHALAALAAYPELSCDSTKKYAPATTWGVFDDVFCPSETTFKFIDDVMTEVCALFPSKYIHIGGDECPKKAWKNSAFCQDLMKKEGLKNEEELQSYFIKRVEKILKSKGRRIIGWDEILEGGLAPEATVMSWRGTEGGIAAARERHDVIMTPGTHCYFDHYQADPETEPLAIGGFTTLQKVYSYEPTPDVLTAEEAKHILGAQANVWTEYIKTSEYLEYMVFPRACALSEVLWSPKDKRDFKDFSVRLNEHINRLKLQKVNVAMHLYSVSATLNTEKATPSVSLSCIDTALDIRYTTDGTEPKLASKRYEKPLEISDVTTIKALAFKNGKSLGKASKQTFYISPILGKTYTTKIPPKNTYESGKYGLTNGLIGSTKSFEQWTGWDGDDMEVTLDLGEAKQLKKVSLNFLNRPSAWIFLPDYVTLAVSEDGVTWKDVNRFDFKYDNNLKTEMKKATLEVSEYTKPKRYIRIYAKNQGKGPKGHASEGHTVWVFADEIMVHF